MGLPYQEAPVGRLNTDILRIILCIAADHCQDSYRSRHAQMNWVRLGHVCALWRAILLDIPILWAENVFAFGAQRAFDDILTRTRGIPLDIRIRFTGEMSQETAAQIEQVVPRAKLFLCEINSPGEVQLVLNSVISRHLPSLQTMTLHNIYVAHELQEQCPIQSLAGLKALHNLELHRLYLCPPLSGQLVSLRIIDPLASHQPSLTEILNVLSHNTALQDLLLKNVLRDGDTTATRSQLTMPALISLHLSPDTTGTLHSLLSALYMPALQHLNICDERYKTLSSNDVNSLLSSALSACHIVFNILASSKFMLDAELYHHRLDIDLSICHERLSSRQRLSVTLSFTGRSLKLQDIVGFARCFFDAQISQFVQDLRWWARHEYIDDPVYWDTVFSTFNNVEILAFGHRPKHVQDVLAALNCIGRDGNLPLPRLRRTVMKIEPAHNISLILKPFKEAICQRAALGGVAHEAWFFSDAGKWGSNTDEQLRTFAEVVGDELHGLRYNDGRLEGRAKVEEE